MNNIGNPDLLNELLSVVADCEDLVERMRDDGELKNKAAHAYYLERTKRAYAMKTRGESATMISLLIKGLPEVADAKLKYDSAETAYEVDREELMLKKKKIAILEGQIDREWHSG